MRRLMVWTLILTVLATATAWPALADGNKTFDAKIWVSGIVKDLTEAQIKRFNEVNPEGIQINALIEEVSEADAVNGVLEDAENSGDIYCFVQDQFAMVRNAGLLDPLSQETSELVKKANDSSSVSAATSGDQLYAYPLTSDNGYFLYYDKSVIPEEDVGSLEKIITDCEEAEKQVGFELTTSGWYAASFFFATGCESEWTTDDEGNFISLNDTYNSPEGLTAVKGMKKVMDSPVYSSVSDAQALFGDLNGAALVSGVWDAETVRNILGDNMGVAELPSFEVDGTTYHLGSFSGNKLMGVKPQEDAEKAHALHLLAQYLTGEEAQMERYEAVNWGPSNLKDQEDDNVQNNEVLAAMLAQNEYAKPQGQIHGGWWDIASSLGKDVEAATDESGLQQALDHYSERIGEALGKQGWLNNKDGTWSYMDIYGRPVTGMQKIGNDRYFFDENGTMETGWQIAEGKWYHFADSGAMTVGWLAADGAWYYLNADQGMATGWEQVGGEWYYFTDSGSMATGWQNIGGTWYFMDASGTMATGWRKDGDAWYLFDESGVMTTGWRNQNGTWYYFDASGAMVTGWSNQNGTWYYFDASGAMATGWLNAGGAWYYFAPDGSMATGWLNKGGTWYWFDGSGAMATGWKEINGQWEMFADSGAWLYTWDGN